MLDKTAQSALDHTVAWDKQLACGRGLITPGREQVSGPLHQEPVQVKGDSAATDIEACDVQCQQGLEQTAEKGLPPKRSAEPWGEITPRELGRSQGVELEEANR